MQIDWHGEHALCAWVDGQQVAMLDFSTEADEVTVNMLFVKPPFRRRGIGAALLRRLLQCHPQAAAACRHPQLRALLDSNTI